MPFQSPSPMRASWVTRPCAMRRSVSSSNSKRRWRGSGGGEGGEGEETPLLRGDVVSLEPPPLGLRDGGGGRLGEQGLRRGRAGRAPGRGARRRAVHRTANQQPSTASGGPRSVARGPWPAAHGPAALAPCDRRAGFLLSFTVHSTLSFRALADR